MLHVNLISLRTGEITLSYKHQVGLAISSGKKTKFCYTCPLSNIIKINIFILKCFTLKYICRYQFSPQQTTKSRQFYYIKTVFYAFRRHNSPTVSILTAVMWKALVIFMVYPLPFKRDTVSITFFYFSPFRRLHNHDNNRILIAMYFIKPFSRNASDYVITFKIRPKYKQILLVKSLTECLVSRCCISAVSQLLLNFKLFLTRWHTPLYCSHDM
jgi:hypothetical protein